MPKTLLLLLAVTSISCRAWSVNPAISPTDPETDIGPLLGTWQVVKMFDEEPEIPPEIQVTADETEGGLTLSMGPAPNAVVKRAVVADIGDRKVLSVLGNRGHWNLVALEVDPSVESVRVYDLDLAALKEAMDAGELPAVQPPLSFNGDEIEITASKAQLLQYLSENPEVFALEVAVLEKVEG